jgi:hypothetical protein
MQIGAASAASLDEQPQKQLGRAEELLRSIEKHCTHPCAGWSIAETEI